MIKFLLVFISLAFGALSFADNAAFDETQCQGANMTKAEALKYFLPAEDHAPETQWALLTRF